MAAFLALAVVAVQAVGATASADAADPQVTSLTAEGFTGATTADPGWYLPPSDSKGACLTAGTDTTQTPIPACDSSAIDSGRGALRLTANELGAVGTVYSTTSFPTSQGLDVQFNTYQWNSNTDPGADGISFILAATDPTNPAPPANTGPIGGSLGYSSIIGTPWWNPDGVPGVTNGYLGFGLDVYGNYTNSFFGGTDCPESDPTPQNVTVRGPGNGTSGYCIAGTQQVENGSLDAQYATERPTPVPVEVALNPESSPTTSTGGVTVPARSWMVSYTPVGGSEQTLTGALPDAATLRNYGFPDSYYDPATGLPYQLTFGWAASTGGNDEIHEVNRLGSSTLTGQLPDFNVALADDQGGTLLAGSTAAVAVTPSLEANQGDEARPATVTTTFPAGLVPTNPTGTAYVCSTDQQVVSCTYTPSSAIAAGTSLPTLNIPVQVGTTPTTGLTITAKVSSTDANPAEATRTVSVVAFSASATPDAVTYGAATTLAGDGLPSDATGTVTFTTGSSTLCTATLPDTSCSTPTTLSPGSYPVTATYSGDATHPKVAASTTFSVSQADAALTAQVSDDSVPYGTPDTLSFSGLPAGATGSVTFAAGSSTLCTVADVTVATSCATPSDLAVGTYAVTATYSGDANVASTTAQTSFSVEKLKVALHAAASQDQTPFGTADTLSVSGLPQSASGTVTFTTSDDTTLCTITDVSTTTSCRTPADLEPGTYAVTAVYSGDAHHLKDQATLGFDVVKARTRLVASVSDPSVPFGTSSTLSFSGLPTDAAGTVAFTTGSQTLCTVDITEGSSCASPKDLSTGEHVVTAFYPGDDHYSASQDRTDLTVTAAGSPTFTASASDPAPTFGTTDTLAFSGLADGATGSVTFTAAGQNLCQVSDVTRSSSCTTSDHLAVGDYDVTATYSGDDDHAAASASVRFSVVKASTTLSAAAAASTIEHGLAQTLSFGSLPTSATGSVTFRDGSGDVLCRVADVVRASSCQTSSSLASGDYAVTASYSGDHSYDASTAETAFTVAPRKNTAPTAQALTIETGSGTATQVTLSGHDDDGDTLAYEVDDQPAHGTLSGTAPRLVYTPHQGYSGPDSFTYTVNDGQTHSEPATVSITVDAPAPDPTPTPDPASTTPTKEFVVDRNGTHHSSSITSGTVKVRKDGELLVALVTANGPADKTQTIDKVSGGGLEWTLLERGNSGPGTSEVWKAYAPRSQKAFRVKAAFARRGYSSKITVAGFTHASSATGASAHSSGKRSAPSVTLVPQASNSVIWAAGRVVGERYDPRPATGTRIVHDVAISHPRVGYWVQKSRSPSAQGQPVTISANVTTSKSWGLTAVEIRGAVR